MKQVLIVDDEKILLNRLIDGFEPYRDDITVLTAQNGLRALDVLKENPVDLLVTDINMPEMGGLELVARVTSDYPHIPFIVMTAFGTPEIVERLNQLSTLKYIEKPFSFDELADVVIENLIDDIDQGSMKGISLANFIQLIDMEDKTCLLDVRSVEDNRQYGLVYCHSGELYNAIYGDLKGEDAIYALLALDDVRITFKPQPKKKIRRRINKELMSILIESARRRDESEDEQKKGGEEAFPGALNESSIFDDSEDMIEIDMEPDLKEDPAPIEEDMIEIDTEPDLKLAPTPIEEDMIEIDAEPDLKLAPTPIEEDMIEIDAEPDLKEDPDPVETEAINHESKGGMDMSAVSDILDKFKDVEGFMAAGVFTPDGEMAAELNVTGVKFGEIGALANDVLLKSQKATEMMGMGRGNQIHIESPKAHILARCLNEATDFAATSTGRAHIHTVLVLNKDGGNVGMGKIKLNSAVEELAPNFR